MILLIYKVTQQSSEGERKILRKAQESEKRKEGYIWMSAHINKCEQEVRMLKMLARKEFKKTPKKTKELSNLNVEADGWERENGIAAQDHAVHQRSFPFKKSR